jgi:murein DD-endopeptidase MepM/ murein hydrolase activator NlpD
MRNFFSNKVIQSLGLVTIIGVLIPQNLQMPVEGASQNDYNKDAFWYYPWGKSITHKGVDIFASKGTLINSSTSGLVVYTGTIDVGGTIVIILGPKWRLHYYAHLDTLKTTRFTFVTKQTVIGTDGNSANAAGKASHLHYAIATLVPYFWRIDNDRQG